MPALSGIQKLGIGILAGSLVLGGWTAKTSIDQDRLSDCIARYTETAAVATVARAELAKQDRSLDESDRQATQALYEAMAAFFVALSNQQKPGGEAEARRTFATLVQTQTAAAQTWRSNSSARKQNQLTRDQNPIPDPPSKLCA